MFAPKPKGPPLSPIFEVPAMALVLFLREPSRLVATATAGTLTASMFGALFEPETVEQQLAWGVLVASVAVALLAPAAYFVMCALGRRPLTVSTGIFALLTFGPKFFAIGLLFGFATLPLVVAPFLAPIAIYVLTRLSLTGMAVLAEDNTLWGAFARSWQLVEGRWWRTFALQLMVGIFAFSLLSIANLIGHSLGSAPVTLVLTALAHGVAAPLIAGVDLVLFNDYRFADKEAESAIAPKEDGDDDAEPSAGDAPEEPSTEAPTSGEETGGQTGEESARE